VADGVAGVDGLPPAEAGVQGLADGAVQPEPGMVGSALELIDAGGPVVIILLIMSVIALTIMLLKLWQFRAARLGERVAARKAVALFRQGHGLEALVAVRGSRNPVAKVVGAAIQGRLRNDLVDAVVREEALRLGGDLLESLRAYLRPLEVIASLAPLLGLFGTVLGMIGAFQEMERAGSQVNPSTLSGGIWEALLTTAVGLAVAIPVVAVLNWLERVVERVTHDMDSAVTQVFTEDLTAQELPHEHRRHAGMAAAGQ
jgi:biopolymer transport protein ExbB